MAKGKYQASTASHKQLGPKTLVLIVVLVLVLCTIIGGTIAYLMDQTETIVNTFTYGDINIDLEETTGEEYKMMPGIEIEKDPTVTVKQGSEDCWLFVQLEKSDNFDDFMSYEMAEGWNQLFDADGNKIEGVFYRIVDGTEVETEDIAFPVLLDDQVTVLDSVTKDQLNALEETDPPAYPTLSITAYAVQRSSEVEAIDTALEAWELTQEQPEEPTP